MQKGPNTNDRDHKTRQILFYCFDKSYFVKSLTDNVKSGCGDKNKATSQQ